MSLDKLQEIFFSTVDMPSEEEAVKTIDFCLKVGVDVNARDKESYTLLHRAAAKEKELIFKKLVESGANVNLQLDNGASILGCAALTKNSFYKMVLNSGTDINLRGKTGYTVLLGLLVNNDTVKSKMLIEKGADVNIANDKGETPLMFSSENVITKMLLDKGAKVNQQDIHGNTALLCASNSGRLEKVEILLAAGADPFLTNNKTGKTPLDYAKEGGYTRIIALLEKAEKKNKKFTPTVLYKLDLQYNDTIFEGSMSNGQPDEGFIIKPNGAKYPVQYVDGEFLLTGPISVNAEGKYVLNI